MGVYTHCDGAGTGEAGEDGGIYFPPLEHGHKMHCDSSYHEIFPSGGAESGTGPSRQWWEHPTMDILGIKAGYAAAEGGGDTGMKKLEGEGVGE